MGISEPEQSCGALQPQTTTSQGQWGLVGATMQSCMLTAVSVPLWGVLRRKKASEKKQAGHQPPGAAQTSG